VFTGVGPAEIAEIIVIIGSSLLIVTSMAATVTISLRERARRRYSRSVRMLQAARQQATGPVPLEDEISQVSKTLSRTVTRLRQISEKAVAFEEEVKQLVREADAAKATAELNEDQARKISMILNAQSESSLRAEMEKLEKVYDKSVRGLVRSGWLNLLIGVILGAIISYVLNEVAS
jgi:hypothetical protein